MPISFACASCDRSYTVADGMAGKRLRCKSCGDPMQVPSAAADAQRPAQDEGVSFDCPDCGRKYRVSAGLAGRTVRCKDCKAEVQVPAAAGSGLGAAGALGAEHDLYGLADMEEKPGAGDDGDLPLPPRTSRPTWKTAGTKSKRGPGFDNDLMRKGMGVMGFGAFATALPFFGLTLGRGKAGLPQEMTTAIGIGCLVVGGIMAAIGHARR